MNRNLTDYDTPSIYIFLSQFTTCLSLLCYINYTQYNFFIIPMQLQVIVCSLYFEPVLIIYICTSLQYFWDLQYHIIC